MGNIQRSFQPQQQQQEPVDLHGLTPATAAIAALTRDLRSFESSSVVPEGLGQHVTSSKTASSNHLPTSIPEGVQFVLNTLPVNEKCIGDGDGFTAYVAIRDDPRELGNVPQKVCEMLTERTEARIRRDYLSADTLRSTIDKAGYKIIICSGNEIVARKYRIRMRGIDAPELKMPYGKESKNALVKLIGGKSTTIYVYEQDQFERYVGDIYCENVFIQEQMLKNGHVWHFKNYDKRPEFFEWERKARAARKGLWASSNPEKPWDWRRDDRNGGHDTIEWGTFGAKVVWFIMAVLLALLIGGRNLLPRGLRKRQ